MSVRRMLPRKRVSRVLPALVGALMFPLVAQAFEPFVVRDIRVEGIQRTDAGTVFGYLPVKVGEQFTEAEATEAVRRLYGTGFFSDVRIETDGSVVVVVVEERPTIASITFNGMREFDATAITDSLRQVGFGEGRTFDRSMLERDEMMVATVRGLRVATLIPAIPDVYASWQAASLDAMREVDETTRTTVERLLHELLGFIALARELELAEDPPPVTPGATPERAKGS